MDNTFTVSAVYHSEFFKTQEEFFQFLMQDILGFASMPDPFDNDPQGEQYEINDDPLGDPNDYIF